MIPFSQHLLLITLLAILIPAYCRSPRPPCKMDLSEFMPSASIREDGSAWDPETSTLYPNGTFWVWAEENSNSSVLMGCPCNLGLPCIRKCCQIGQVMDSSLRCVPRNATYGDGGAWFRPELAEHNNGAVLSVNGSKTKLGIVTEKHCYPRKKSKLVKEEEYFVRSKDANLCDGKTSKCVGIDQFCLDYVQDLGHYLPVKCPWKKKGWTVKFVHTARENMLVNVFKFFTQTVSCLALSIILLLYIHVPSLRNVHGKCHMCHSVSLLAYYTVETITLHSWYLLELKGICYVLGPAQFFFHLTPLSWLNVMSVDILFAFLNLRPVGSKLSSEWKKFLYYSLYAWGVPFTVFIITLIVDFAVAVEDRPTADDWCIKGRFRNWDYKRITMYTLLAINGIIFACTAVKIYMLKRESSVLHTKDSKRHSKDDDNGNKRTKVYLRLLLLMGFHWILEPMAKALHTPLRLDERLALRTIWYILAIVNRLQGLFILLMFLGTDKLTSAVWLKFSKSNLWAKLTNQPSLRKMGIATIGLNKFGNKAGVRPSIDSTETTENELSDASRSDPTEGAASPTVNSRPPVFPIASRLSIPNSSATTSTHATSCL